MSPLADALRILEVPSETEELLPETFRIVKRDRRLACHPDKQGGDNDAYVEMAAAVVVVEEAMRRYRAGLPWLLHGLRQPGFNGLRVVSLRLLKNGRVEVDAGNGRIVRVWPERLTAAPAAAPPVASAAAAASSSSTGGSASASASATSSATVLLPMVPGTSRWRSNTEFAVKCRQCGLEEVFADPETAAAAWRHGKKSKWWCRSCWPQ